MKIYILFFLLSIQTLFSQENNFIKNQLIDSLINCNLTLISFNEKCINCGKIDGKLNDTLSCAYFNESTYFWKSNNNVYSLYLNDCQISKIKILTDSNLIISILKLFDKRSLLEEKINKEMEQNKNGPITGTEFIFINLINYKKVNSILINKFYDLSNIDFELNSIVTLYEQIKQELKLETQYK